MTTSTRHSIKRVSLSVVLLGSTAYAGFTLYPDIPYHTIPGVDPNLLSLDVYVPEDANGTNPVMVMYHGGGFTSGDKNGDPGVAHPKMEYYTNLGWVFVNANYRLTMPQLSADHPDQVSHPDHINDVAHSIAWIIDNIGGEPYNGDPGRIVLMGFSAGAQLVALAGTDESRLEALGYSLRDIKGVIALDGMYDVPLRYEQVQPPPPVMDLVWGTDLDTRQDMSPALHAEPNEPVPPMLLIHQNQQMNIEQNEHFHDILSALGYDATIYNAVGLTHSQIGGLVGTAGHPLTLQVDAFLAGLPCNAADLAGPVGVLDLADIAAFTAGFVAQEVSADIAEPFGVFDLGDLGAFVGAFVAGCP